MSGLLIPAPPAPLTVISPWSGCSLGGSAGGTLGTIASGAYPAANRGLFIPFRITTPYLVKRAWTYNGTTMAGTNTVDIGVYTAGVTPTRLFSSGPITITGTSVIQSYDLTGVAELLRWLQPGLYYLAISLSSASDHLFRVALAALFMAGFGCAQQASIGTLPATATLAAVASAYVPMFGISNRGFV